ncbi:uncharacterized protein A1O9_05845 [Exophiala aquamarina CBS 119918]|uniref:Calcineurin-like phosphoesterase domain-containing protein n=1 Tax=Exophiala aquamarina CBS 119918 TaxID=1182545 RepID=A0A072PF84_9EURO|nr:uncharacterized protein A1O9_05845 [Exophiala aquamarina CBS 119918]KEF57923.1 hypothetical protein A1O9_05845 [Exophiala aquamarina CBS 119918]
MATRRVRLVCISDTHNQTPKLPSGDILIHAGDFSNQGTFSELQKTIRWLQQTQCRTKILVCGNHDITCDVPFYAQHGGRFHNKKIEDPQRCIDLFYSDPTFIYLNHEAKDVRIDFDDDTHALLKVFGSPYSPAKGFWAFGYDPETASQLWSQIPLGADLVITHAPAKGHRDRCSTRDTAGCDKLLAALSQVRPKIFVCGHIHEGYGVEIVTWDLSSSIGQSKENSVRQLEDQAPESKKLFVVDLSSRSRDTALQNDCSIGQIDPESEIDSTSDINSEIGRRGKAQTCIVNAAFMASNWPHKDGKAFHKPVVIDIDLPILQNPVPPTDTTPESSSNKQADRSDIRLLDG